ncbi:Crustacean neurohormone [Aphelenchoides avenae]|nr:Crustacean neurohormone [Aphelenchus avenae]
MISDRRVPIHCGIFENRELLSVVERICDLCHETYYEVYPRMGSDCRSQCYGSEQFKLCFNLFRIRRRMRAGQ